MPGPLQPRLPFAPLAELAAARQWSVTVLADEIGVDVRDVYRWRAEGGIPERSADRAAVALGLTPELLWGPAAWGEATAGLVARAEAAEAKEREAAERAEARRRAMHAAAKRRWRNRHLDVRERERIRNNQWKAENTRKLAIYNAQYDRGRRRLLRAERGHDRPGQEGPHLQDEVQTGKDPHRGLQGGQHPHLVGPDSTPEAGQSTTDGVMPLGDNGATAQEVA